MKTQDVSYRIAYKSDHLGVVDLEEMIENKQSLIVTIKEVWHEQGAVVAGSKGNFNIAYFEENIKPLVLNSTNATTVRRLCNGGATLNTWKMPVTVELFIDASVKMKGQIVGGVRLRRAELKKQIDVKNALAKLNACKTRKELPDVWDGLSSEEKSNATVIALKDKLKNDLK